MTPILTATLAVLVIAVAVAGYVATCATVPFTGCRACQHTGYRTTRSGHKLKRCRRCRGTGTRLRTGRKLYNHARRIHADATTTTMPRPRDPKQPPGGRQW